MKRPVIVGLITLAVFVGGLILGWQTAPSERRPLFGSLDRSFAVDVALCTKPSPTTTRGSAEFEVQNSATIRWQSGWKPDEFIFDSHGFGPNVQIGLSWDESQWPFAGMSVAEGHGWSVAPAFTPSGRAAEKWAIAEAQRKNLRWVGDVAPATFMQRLGPSTGVWVLEDFYSESPRGIWKATFKAFSTPKPSTVTFAMFDVDGSVIEKTLSLACHG